MIGWISSRRVEEREGMDEVDFTFLIFSAFLAFLFLQHTRHREKWLKLRVHLRTARPAINARPVLITMHHHFLMVRL